MNLSKWIMLAFLILDAAYMTARVILATKQCKKPLPENVSDVYDSEKYALWCNYNREKKLIGVTSYAVSFAVTAVLFLTNVFSDVYYLIPIKSGFWRQIVIYLALSFVTWLLGIVPSYISKVKIENKYGFNNMTMGTFIGDLIKNLIISLVIDFALLSICILAGNWLSDANPVLPYLIIYGIFAAVIVLINMFATTFMKIFNKFTPLEDGSLRQRIVEVFKSSGYELREIYVINESKRSTRSNAFCSGIGKTKKITLYDNLVNNYSEDEIVAVFAHELGHYKHHDMAAQTVLNLLSFIPLFAAVALLINSGLCADYGFDGMNMAFILAALLNIVASPLLMICQLPVFAFSRHCEYRADRFAAERGAGEALISSLKHLTGNDFGNVNPHPWIVFIEYSHPTLSQRIEAIRKVENNISDNKSEEKL